MCIRDSHVAHDAGWRIDPTDRAFIAPGRGVVPDTTALAHADIGDMIADLVWSQPEPGPLQTPLLDRLDLNWTVAVIAENARLNQAD